MIGGARELGSIQQLVLRLVDACKSLEIWEELLRIARLVKGKKGLGPSFKSLDCIS
jgi:hypothetical protein